MKDRMQHSRFGNFGKQCIVLVTFLCAFHSTLHAKDLLITLHYNNVPLKTILLEVERQSKMVFIYNNEKINDSKLRSIHVQNLPVKNVLTVLFEGQSIEARIVDYYIFLSPSLTKALPVNELNSIVEGSVKDENLQALPGVSILSAERVVKAVTDINGNFSLEVLPEDSVLSFYMMGFLERTVKVNSRKPIDVLLRNNNVLLQELIVVGYGMVNYKELTGSVATMKPDLITKTVGGDVSSSFQGQLAGVYVNNDKLRVRGVSSINASSDPFLVVDGIPQSIQLKDINPDDIESIEVLKDAASAAIYGSRAANGVLLITTRNARFDTPVRLTTDYRSGINYVVNTPSYLKGQALLNLIDDAYYNRYPERKSLPESDPNKYFPLSSNYSGYQGYDRAWINSFLSDNPEGTDWRDVMTQAMNYQDFRLSLQGGQAQSKFMISFSYRTNNDFIQGKSSDRITLLMKNDYAFTKKLMFGLSSNLVTNLSENSTYPATMTPFVRSSLLPVYAPDSSEVLFDARNINSKKGSNPLYQMQQTWDDNVEFNEVLSAYFEYKPSKNFSLRTDWSGNFGTRRYRYYQSKDFYREDEAIDPTKSGLILYARTLNYGFNANNVLTYSTDVGERSRFKLMAGNNIQSYNSDFNVMRLEGFPTDYFQLTNANTEKVYTRQSAGMDGYRFVSFFARTQYSFKDKWFAEFNARTDATSRFVEGKRSGFFPGFGLSWVVSDESFIKLVKKIDYLKTRLSVGQVGNAEMGNFPTQSRVVNWAEYAGSPGFLFDRIGSPDLSWEKQVQVNYGINLASFKNRVIVNLDLFYKRSNNLLINYNIGNFQGYVSSEVIINTGEMSNKGLDLSIRTVNLKGKFTWETDFNVSTFKTKVLQLSSQQDYIEKGVNRVVVGQPLALYFTPMWAGIDPITGHELIYEMTGPEHARTKTGNILDAEVLDLAEYNRHRVFHTDKTPYPVLYGGVTNSFKYKAWEFSFLVYFQYGNWLYNSGLMKSSYISTYDIENKYVVMEDHWTVDNPNSKNPLLYNSQMANRNNDRYLVDGSYLRLRNVDLRYALPSQYCNALHAKNIRLFLQAQNLITLSAFKNGDPEVVSGSSSAENNITPGIVGANFGIMSVNVGVNLEF